MGSGGWPNPTEGVPRWNPSDGGVPSVGSTCPGQKKSPWRGPQWAFLAFPIKIIFSAVFPHFSLHNSPKVEFLGSTVPENLLLTADQKTVKLVDFGLAREETLTEMMTAETGTYRWMAPENVRPSADDLPEELAHILTSCWKEDPNSRPNFSQIVQMLLNYLSTLSPPKPVAPVRVFSSENTVLPPESPGTSSLMAVRDDVGETPKGRMESRSRGFFFCFNQCY
ncbi:hypothetical protein Taro_043554 [Colocasia esculenta]|uniref:Protein kinase domain-containing protein n=1 Tax=Colocasia esculenta TaxID=4460 RepID=A0A843WLF1_COLES|nr:hypothetical protein [Colocasia esculenta]